MATNFVLYRTRSLGAKVSQDPLDRFSQSLHRMVGIELQMNDTSSFFRYFKGRCHGNQFSGKNRAKLPTALHLSLCHSEMEWHCLLYTSPSPRDRQMIISFYFFRYLKGRRHGNQFSGKNRAKLPTPVSYTHLTLPTILRV